MMEKMGWSVFALTKKTYIKNGIFNGGWHFYQGKFKIIHEPIRVDLVYDRTGGLAFPPLENDRKMIVVDNRDFKKICWNKYLTYKEIGKFMPKTFWVGQKINLSNVLLKIKTDWVVLKPASGLMGIGIFIGPKDKALKFRFKKKYANSYIAQEFLDTSCGIKGITKGVHDLRAVIVNKKIVWSHVRVPPKGKHTANAAQGGTLREISLDKLPNSVKQIVREISPLFYKKYDNPLFSLDFGITKEGPKVIEINDTIGFPKPKMRARDNFLKELIKNFTTKI
jgi:glutathione synthase/RimK-type ligase-like ATP-grasp enzyme